MELKDLQQDPLIKATGWTDSDIPVFVMLGADWCSYCVKQKPIVQKLAQDYAGKVRFEILNSDEHKDLKKALGVSGIPAMFIFGKHLTELVYAKGYQGRITLKRKIDRALAATPPQA